MDIHAQWLKLTIVSQTGYKGKKKMSQKVRMSLR